MLHRCQATWRSSVREQRIEGVANTVRKHRDHSAGKPNPHRTGRESRQQQRHAPSLPRWEHSRQKRRNRLQREPLQRLQLHPTQLNISSIA
jgi:hypothetical protein